MYELNIELKYAGLFEKVHLGQATSKWFYKNETIRKFFIPVPSQDAGSNFEQ